MTDTNISKFSFLLERTNFIIGKNCCQMPWSDRLVLFISKKMSAKYPSLNDDNMSISSHENTMLPEKRSQFIVQPKHCGRAFPPDNQHSLVCRSALWVLSVLSQRILKRCEHEGWDFYCFIKGILKWNWYFSCRSNKVKNRTAACAMALISAKAPKVSQALVLHH